ncbi:MAG: hypothetical protein DWQ09_09265 [Proteobacteria bacterium]|nr:MAG: hypothetical protein DWQ09_09265 [Pseudomonadota bacterium]QKK10668.1 MAG: hypothetical protein HND59_02715 [Pseudomonadota bacterium]
MPVDRLLLPALLIGLLASIGVSRAEEPDANLPDAELLEFIASFATDDGGWLDPLELDIAARPEDSTDEVQQ